MNICIMKTLKDYCPAEWDAVCMCMYVCVYTYGCKYVYLYENIERLLRC